MKEVILRKLKGSSDANSILQILLFISAIFFIYSCENKVSINKIKELNHLIINNDSVRKCLILKNSRSCLTLIEADKLFNYNDIVDIRYHSEINKSSDSLDFCISYKIKNERNSKFVYYYLYVADPKYKSKYLAYEQYSDGRSRIQNVDSLWSITKNIEFVN